MKKIMFNDKYGLTEAVLTGRKTQTRRIITNCTRIRLSPFNKSGVEDNHGYELKPRFHVGEIIAIAQSYKDCTDECIRNTGLDVTVKPHLAKEAGYKNKMFVRADLYEYIKDAWKAGYAGCESDIVVIGEPLFKPSASLPRIAATDELREYEKTLLNLLEEWDNPEKKAAMDMLMNHLFEDCMTIPEAHAKFLRQNDMYFRLQLVGGAEGIKLSKEN